MPRGSIVTEIPVPTPGARSDVPRHRLPPDAMVADDAANVVIRDGWLVNRPGFSAINSTLVSGRPMGVILFKTGASSKFLVVGTTTTLAKLNAAQTGWDALTGATALTGSADDPISFTVFPQGGSDYLIAVNGVNVPQEWDGVAGTFSDSGTLPIADDITTAANRVLLLRTIEGGTRYNFRVRWSNFNVRGTSDSANFVDLSDTSDILVGGRALSRVQVAIYKEASQWIGVAQSGSQPFRFDLRDSMPGPVSSRGTRRTGRPSARRPGSWRCRWPRRRWCGRQDPRPSRRAVSWCHPVARRVGDAAIACGRAWPPPPF